MVVFVPKSCLFDFFLLRFFKSYREIDTVQCKNAFIVSEKYIWGDLRGVWASYLMLACYYPQGKQLASGVIGLLTCQSHYKRLRYQHNPMHQTRHPLDQCIATQKCESVVRPATVNNVGFQIIQTPKRLALGGSHLHKVKYSPNWILQRRISHKRAKFCLPINPNERDANFACHRGQRKRCVPG